MAFNRLSKRSAESKKPNVVRVEDKSNAVAAGAIAPRKFGHPKILLLDIEQDAVNAISRIWSDVNVGTLGKPYKITKSAGFNQVIQRAELEGHEEAELVVVDLSMTEIADVPDGEPHRPAGEVDLWAKCDVGYIDARVRTVLLNTSKFDRILNSGGAFVVFASAPSEMSFLLARYTEHYGLSDEGAVERDVWSITSELGNLTVTADCGESIKVVNDSPVGSVLAKYKEGARFECTLQTNYKLHGEWETLAVNKFGHPIAMLGAVGSGHLIVVPQLKDKAAFLSELMSVALPDLTPHLFPEMERGGWIRRSEYELQRVVELESEKAAAIEEAKKAVMRIDGEIAAERAASGWVHDLLTGTGETLVTGVKRALAEMGFEQVVDVDELRDKDGLSRREDLRIEDASPMLVVDIKGVGGRPADDDVTQATKHAFINMKELGRTDINGLSIINHQRHLPPLDRDNSAPFRKELLDVAGETHLGMITSFDLYRLVLNAKKLGWKPHQVMGVFYLPGRIDPVPAHYRYIGKVAKVMTGKFGVLVTDHMISVGDRVAVEGPIYFDEAEVGSVQVNNASVESAKVGEPAGLLWPDGKMKLREGMRVFAVPH